MKYDPNQVPGTIFKGVLAFYAAKAVVFLVILSTMVIAAILWALYGPAA